MVMFLRSLLLGFFFPHKNYSHVTMTSLKKHILFCTIKHALALRRVVVPDMNIYWGKKY